MDNTEIELNKEPVDISVVKINMDLPVEERIKDYIRQIKNPYRYLYNGMEISIKFSGKAKLEECMKTALFPNV